MLITSTLKLNLCVDYHFKPGRTYWICIILFRKFWLGVAALIFADSPSFCLAFVLMVLFSNYVFHVLKRPFMSSVEQEGAVKAHEAMVEDHIAREAANGKLGPVTREGRRAFKIQLLLDRVGYVRDQSLHIADRARLTEIREYGIERSRRHQAEMAREFYFDFNTVESLLLASAILVCLFGIMFESPVNSSSAAWDSALGILTVLVISFSLFYYFVVFLSEVCTVLGIENAKFLKALMKLCASRGKIQNNKNINELGDGDDDDDNVVNPVHGMHAGDFEMYMAQVEFDDNIDSARVEAIEKDQRINELLAEQREKKKRQAKLGALERGLSSQKNPLFAISGDTGSSDVLEVALVEKTPPSTLQWAEYVDEGTGKTYFHNSKSGEVTWEKPRELEKITIVKASSANDTTAGRVGRRAQQPKKKKKKRGIGKRDIKEIADTHADDDGGGL